MAILFTRDAHQRIADGTITVTFRFWKRPHVKVGGRYSVGPTRIEVDEIELIPFAAVGDADARRAGCADREALRTLISHAGPVHDDTIVHRVEFHRVEPDAAEGAGEGAGRAPQPVDAASVAAAATRLDRLDARSTHGPWTRRVLALIGDQPGVVSTTLAEQMGRERLKFKADVRKLKAIGLTESLEVGYRLTPLGERLRG